MKRMKKRCPIFLATVIVGLSLNSFAMGKPPRPETPGPDDRVPQLTSPAAPNSELFPPPGFDVFAQVAYPVGALVDSQFQSYRELLPQRAAQLGHASDRCDINLNNNDRFADRIAYAVALKLQPSRAGLGYVGTAYKLGTNEDSYFPNSLISHPLCTVSESSLTTTLGSKRVPSASTIKKANQLATQLNNYRQQALAGHQEGYLKAAKLWAKLMMCVSYTESLTSANTGTSDRVAQKNAPSDYRRPAGVLFYEDPYQSAESKLNIGLFQFTPNSSGNVLACIREWNKLYPQCGISPRANQAEMVRLLGSSLQTFNAFCGVAKVTGSFSVQVNTSGAGHTHPDNVVKGVLKAPVERCVSPHFLAGKAYNHFGPFQNSTGSNLEEILSCTLAGEY